MLPPATESASTGAPLPQPPRVVDPDEKVCYNCETRSTPLWRLSREDGQWRCNACGIYLKHKHMERPLSLATNSERAARSAAAAQARRTAPSPRLPRPDNMSGAHVSGWDSDDDGSSSGTEPLRKSTRVRKPVCRDLSPSPPRWRGGRPDRDDGWMGDHQPVFVPPYWTKGSPQSVEDLQSSLIDLLLRQQVDALTDSQAALVLMRLPTQSHGVVTEATVHGPWRRHAMMPQGDGDSDHGMMEYPPIKRAPLSSMLPPPYSPHDTVKTPPKRACRRPDRPPMQCANCGVLDTPLWRKASDGSGATLCNACGIYLKTHNVHRPVHTMSASRTVVTSPRPLPPSTPHKRKANKPAAPAALDPSDDGSDADDSSHMDGRPPATPLQVPQPRTTWSPGSLEGGPSSSSPEGGGHPLDSLAPPLRAAALTQLLPFIMQGVPAAATAAAAATGGTNSPSGLATQCPSPRYTAPVIPPAGH